MYKLKINDPVQILNKDLIGVYCGQYKGKARVFLDEPLTNHKTGNPQYIVLCHEANLRPLDLFTYQNKIED